MTTTTRSSTPGITLASVGLLLAVATPAAALQVATAAGWAFAIVGLVLCVVAIPFSAADAWAHRTIGITGSVAAALWAVLLLVN